MYFEAVIQRIRKMESPGVYMEHAHYWSAVDITLDEYLADDWYVTDEEWVRRESWPVGAFIRPAP